MTVTPLSMPKKVSPIKTQILGSLIEKTGGKLRYPLAQNVQESNVEVLAKRWF